MDEVSVLNPHAEALTALKLPISPSEPDLGLVDLERDPLQQS
jgi:hypothetical protein